MLKRQETSTSMFAMRTKQKTRDKIFNKKNEIRHKKRSIAFGIGVLLSLATIVLQCVAFFTPHWKEISPNTHSLYVDGVDALIRTEVLHYFNTIHRYTRHSYGLFQRCEYLLGNASVYNNQKDLRDLIRNNERKKCTKNYLPSYVDDHFNLCHSLPYYRFCTKAGEKNFNINNDYLRATFDISPSQANSAAKSSCDCSYPPYVVVCRIIGIIALVFLFLTNLLYILFSLFTDPHHRLKIKCFAVLSSLLGIIFLMINLIVISQNLEYESIEYLIAIQRHYRTTQIYKLSEDTKIAIDRFISSINIRVGYSTIIAWIAFALSIIDGILLLFTCRIKDKHDENETSTNLISSKTEEEHSPLTFAAIPSDSQSSPPPQIHVINNIDQNERYQPIRIQQQDEV
jgi:hypothetical protein